MGDYGDFDECSYCPIKYLAYHVDEKVITGIRRVIESETLATEVKNILEIFIKEWEQSKIYLDNLEE